MFYYICYATLIHIRRWMWFVTMYQGIFLFMVELPA